MFELDFNSDKPIYTQLYEEIILAISRGELKSQDSLPSVRALATEIGINLHTVNKAYTLLKDEGYISIDRRKGALITDLPLSLSDETKEVWLTQFKLLTAKAHLQGLTEEEFLKLCKQLYNKEASLHE